MKRLPLLSLALVLGCTGVGSSTPCAAGLEPFPPGAVELDPRCPGACDPVAARALVYDGGGGAAYAGQALLNVSCSASYCHAAEATGDLRIGAPAGLDFVAFPGSTPAQLDELARVHGTVVQWRDDIWGAITSGEMPPGARGREVIAETSPYRWQRLDGPELAPLETPEGREIVRNWLACGAPYVDRSDVDGSLRDCPAEARCGGDWAEALPMP